jgi:hypothetical protein
MSETLYRDADLAADLYDAAADAEHKAIMEAAREIESDLIEFPEELKAPEITIRDSRVNGVVESFCHERRADQMREAISLLAAKRDAEAIALLRGILSRCIDVAARDVVGVE